MKAPVQPFQQQLYAAHDEVPLDQAGNATK
jgi:hypothetical protein